MNGSPVVKKIPANKKDRYLLKTGIYVRVSSGKVEQLRSLSAQASALTRYVYFRENWVLKDMYIEVGSAKPGSSRREFFRHYQWSCRRTHPVTQGKREMEQERNRNHSYKCQIHRECGCTQEQP